MADEPQVKEDPFPGIPLKVSQRQRKGEKDQPKANEVFFINEVQSHRRYLRYLYFSIVSFLLALLLFSFIFFARVLFTAAACALKKTSHLTPQFLLYPVDLQR